MYLRDRADSEGKCWPGIKTIASDMRLSRSTVKRALTDLEQHGYLQRSHATVTMGAAHPTCIPCSKAVKKAQSSAKGGLRPFAEPRGGS